MDRWFNRYYEKVFDDLLKQGKVLIIYGPRRVGKTALINKLLEQQSGKTFKGTGDDMELRDVFTSGKLQRISNMFGGYDIVFIDEAQRIPEVGLGLKMLVDHHNIKIVISGSSSLDLTNKVGEPLTGRQVQKILFPLSVLELSEQFGGFGAHQRLEELLIFGGYPEVLNQTINIEKIEYLTLLRDTYLLKDLFETENIRNPSRLLQLLKLLAYQIGNEVSLSELGAGLNLSRQSVERYLYLLEKAFVIQRVGGFSRNLRSEVIKTARYYFWDNGVRNALINNFNPIASRDDVGKLWENFLFIERMKKLAYHRIPANVYFWRTYDKKEIDFVEERDGELYGFEFKWKPKKIKPPALWLETYQNATFEVISPENYLEFVL
ncbi:MAG: ATP-binding protein [Clostridia bacterium]|nr:ATP-binding protein [Clostridia bacterium]